MEEPISTEDYQKVLRYMQERNQEDFDRAVLELRRHGFNLQMALGGGAAIEEEQAGQEEMLNRYILFLERKKHQEPSFMWFAFSQIKYLFNTIFSTITRIILPRSLIARFFYPKFYSLHYNHLNLPVHRLKLQEILAKTKNLQRKSVMVVVTPREVVRQFVDWLKNQEIFQKVFECFDFAGCTVGDRDLELFEGLQPEPQIIICRMNVFEEVIVINNYKKQEFGGITTGDLDACYRKGLEIMKKDKSIVRLYKNFQGEDLEQSSDQEEEQIKNLEYHEEINKQNQAYRALQQQQINRIQRIPEKVPEDHEQEELLRKIRQESIPQEPEEGDLTIFNLRCPNGSTITRKFLKSQKVDLIFNWVELNDYISFQDTSRSFEIMYSFPLKPLSPFKQSIIGEIFEDEQQRLIIRQI